MIPFAEWLPDLPDYKNPGATVAKNVLPHALSYKPFNEQQVASDAMDGACLGLTAMQDSSGNTYVYAGDATKLYSLSAGSWTDVKSGTYTTASPNRWRFVKWGEKCIATNYNDALQVITMGGSNFAALAGSPPKAKHMAVVGDFVVLGNVNDGTAYSNKVVWCGINNEETWTPSATTQSDEQLLYGDGGAIQAIIGGEYGVIFQEYAVVRMTYVGTPIIFQFDELEGVQGTPAPYSVISVNNQVYYLGWDGFYVFNGSQSAPISANKTSKHFFADLDQSYIDQVVSAADPINTLIFWQYHGANHTGTANKLICFNWSNGRWSEIETTLEHLSSTKQEGYTLETLDTLSSTLDGLTISLDSNFYKGGALMLAGVNSDHKLVTFTGDALAGEIETAEEQLTPGRASFVSEIRPIIDGDCTVKIGTRSKHSDSVTYTDAVSTDDEGKADFRSSSRYHRVKVTTTGNYTHAQGIDAEFVEDGWR